MKKLLCVCLVLILALAVFVGCGDQNDADTPGTPDGNNPGTDQPANPDDSGKDEYDVITIARAFELCGESGNVTEERYYIRGTVESITNAQYGAMVIKDATGSISVYGTYSEDGSIGYAEMTDKPYKGDEVLLHCILQNFNGTKEIKNARLISLTHATIDANDSNYTEMTIEEARASAVNTKVKVSGVVARITYANGMKPSGFILVDNTQSIYVYDADIAQRVSVGNKITIMANRANWILESEQTNAEKFGYKGCTQLDQATLVNNDNSTENNIITNWMKENTSTVKNIVDNDVSKDITSTIFKVNALIKRQDGNGFINYYINDLDEKTGSYCYTQCNGSDFAWLDEFDGKICTVYLCPLNCKATASGCAYRFLPVAVEYKNFKFNLDDTAKFVVEYFGVGQFEESYTGDPALQLTQYVDSELLGFEGAKLEYVSYNSDIVSFENNQVMHCLKSGETMIGIKCQFNEVSYSTTVHINVNMDNASMNAGTVKGAIDATIGDEVTIKGIVAGSLVNQDGFYIIDDTGIIAVLTDRETLSTLQQGYEIIIEGTRSFKGKKADSTWGTTCIKDAKVIQNNYGSHEYSTDNFITGKTLTDFSNLDVNEDHTTEVYVLDAKVEVIEAQYYTSIKLTYGDVSVALYCSSANQYAFLKDYAEQTVTLELVPCNWSSKNAYPACVLSVVTLDGRIYNTLNFTSK